MNRLWTPEEEILLETKWGIWSHAKFSEQLGRSTKAIRVKAWKLGLGYSVHSQSGLTMTALSEALGISHSSLIRWHKHHGLPAKCRIVGTSQRAYNINLDRFWEWAEQHQHLMNFSRMDPNALHPVPRWAERKREQDAQVERREWRVSEEREVMDMWRQGMSAPAIAKRVGRTRMSVYRKIQKMEGRG